MGHTQWEKQWRDPGPIVTREEGPSWELWNKFSGTLFLMKDPVRRGHDGPRVGAHDLGYFKSLEEGGECRLKCLMVWLGLSFCLRIIPGWGLWDNDRRRLSFLVDVVCV